MPVSKRQEDTYTLYDHHAICESKSGNTYLITYDPLSCNCKGFGYYQYCRHSKYVSEHPDYLRLVVQPTTTQTDVHTPEQGMAHPPVNVKQSHIDDMVYKLTHKREG